MHLGNSRKLFQNSLSPGCSQLEILFLLVGDTFLTFITLIEFYSLQFCWKCQKANFDFLFTFQILYYSCQMSRFSTNFSLAVFLIYIYIYLFSVIDHNKNNTVQDFTPYFRIHVNWFLANNEWCMVQNYYSMLF